MFAPDWARSALGNPIELHASAPLESLHGKRPILLMGGVHGDEPEGVWLARATLHFLKQKSSPSPPWIVIPCLNVDGFAKRTRGNGRGVDLNRNYPSASWTAECSNKRYFPGAAAGSEPEIQWVVRLLLEFKPRLVIHCHSWDPCIVYSGEPAREDSERLARSSGYEARTEIGYPTPGALSQYGWADLRIPIICIEEKSGTPEREVWPHFAAGMSEIFSNDSPRA